MQFLTNAAISNLYDFTGLKDICFLLQGTKDLSINLSMGLRDQSRTSQESSAIWHRGDAVLINMFIYCVLAITLSNYSIADVIQLHILVTSDLSYGLYNMVAVKTYQNEMLHVFVKTGKQAAPYSTAGELWFRSDSAVD